MVKIPDHSITLKIQKAMGKKIRGEIRQRRDNHEASVFATGNIVAIKYLGSIEEFGDHIFEVKIELPNKEFRTFKTDTLPQ